MPKLLARTVNTAILHAVLRTGERMPEDYISPYEAGIFRTRIRSGTEAKLREKLVKEVRMELAELRKAAGVPRMFWVYSV